MNIKEIKALLKKPLPELIAFANEIRQKNLGNKMELCSIMNAKSGLCGEDCKFCAQSVHHKTGINSYPLKSKAEMLKAAKRAKDIGAQRFDIVTSGVRLAKDEVKKVAEAISQIRKNIGIKMCASLGKLDEEDLRLLKNAGLSRYHHNIETSRRYFPQIVTTHTFSERLETIKAAKSAGLEVCSGGIIGLGETWEDRIDMALTLKELKVTSVPINILVPIGGTPLEKMPAFSCIDAIKTIAIFRVILKNQIIKLAAGRESMLGDFQAMAFLGGANGMLIGGYLTLRGRTPDQDWRLVKEIEKAWQA